MPELLPFIFHFSFLHFSLKLSASSTSMSLGSASGKAAASCWLRLGEEVAGSHLSVCVFIRPELKFEPGYFHPCWLHVSDVSHEVFVLLTRQLSDFEAPKQTMVGGFLSSFFLISFFFILFLSFSFFILSAYGHFQPSPLGDHRGPVFP